MGFPQNVVAQLGHQLLLGRGANSFATLEDKMDYLRDTCLALNIEVSEFLQELPWKPWCPTSGQECNLNNAADEIIDILIFTLNLWINLGQYEQGQCIQELLDRLSTKQVLNLERIKSGYNKTLKN